MKQKLSILALIFVGFATMLLLSGCTLRGVLDTVFGREAAAEEETVATSEEPLLYAQVNDAQGRALANSNGEPLTVLVAYETATGGEPKINSDGILETHPVGEVVTYEEGAPVIGDDGQQETYAGGEAVTDVFGLQLKDEEGEPLTRAEGEPMTHGADEIVYDSFGNRLTYNGEPLTYAAGDTKYDTNGERATYPVTILKDAEGNPVLNENQQQILSYIELVTDEAGNPVIEEDGEAATRLLNPQEPEQVVEQAIEAGNYYINNLTSNLVYFSTPEVEAANIALLADEGVDTSIYAQESGDGRVNNLQLEILGEDLSYLEMYIDLEGYAYFQAVGSDQVLSLAGDLRNGVNVLMKDKIEIPYEQYQYWEDPLCSLDNSQRWVIKAQEDGSYIICSALDESYVMTVDDQFGTQYANIMMWTYDGRDLQKFAFTTETPIIEQYVEEGTYYISVGLSDWMMMSLGDYNYEDGSSLYLNTSDQGDGQQFRISYDDYGFATIEHAESGKVLTVNNAEARNGQSVIQYESDGSDWQKWIIEPHKHGGYYIRSALNISEVVDLDEGEARTYKPINLYWNNDTMAESWYFHEEAIPSPYAYAYMDDYAQNFSSETNYLILVSSDTNHVGIYTGSQGNWTNLYFWNCVTGKYETPTVKGEYTVYVRTPSFDGNMDSPAWYTVYYATGFYPQYFFHSIIYYQATWDIMDASMGYNGSHGCVRLATDNAKWVYENIPDHTKIVSY